MSLSVDACPHEKHVTLHRKLDCSLLNCLADPLHSFANPGQGFAFRAEFNPNRRAHHRRAGIEQPPPGFLKAADGCFFDPRNPLWQRHGRQFPNTRRLADLSYNFLTQPFPFAPMHFTVAPVERAPQDWRETILQLEDGFAALYNGKDAGRSIDWMHFHVLRSSTLPLQAAARIGPHGRFPPLCRRPGTLDDRRKQRPSPRQGNAPQCEPPNASRWYRAMYICYYIPRDRTRESVHSARFTGRVGA